jgi:hypothetical protein
MIVTQTLTDQDTDDPSQVAPLLDQIDDPIGQVTADGAYDGAPTHQTIAQHGDGIEVVIPPRSTIVNRGTGSTDVARSPFGDDFSTRPPGLANCDRLRPALLIRNDNGSIQVADRTAAASPRLCWPADRGCHRRGCAEASHRPRTACRKRRSHG